MRDHQSAQQEDLGARRLKFIFGGEFVLFNMSDEATFEDVARSLAGLATQYGRASVAIDMAVASKSPAMAAQSSARSSCRPALKP